MKKAFLTIAVIAITMLSSSEAFAQKFPKLDVSPLDASSYPSHWKVSDKLVKVVYGRPQLKGRSLDKLAPQNEVWRTGANEAAEIIFYKDVVFGGEKVKAGTYSLFTIPGKNKWTIILNSAKNVWGHYTYKVDQDVVRVKGEVSNSDKPIEAFSIVFEGEGNNAIMYFGWANTIVSVDIKG
ncbi:DUF2911 domain-containing protein [uncultured Polaribacter sp.]|uniref:DUF2911 domain-containing protein n=1 Tax=uncultured Polaribacter sp. TaxID=174711 RepID=UPI00261D00A7|nr:DUF2911 domain-containing protein [uncultured Polaribacter sp.]